MAHLSKSVAVLRIIGDDLDPNEITSLVKCEPSHASTKGQIITSKSGRERIEKSGGWYLDAPDSVPEDLDHQVAFLLNKLNDDLDMWNMLKSKFQLDLF